MAGYYINPYTALIGAANQVATYPTLINGTSTQVICDDFSGTIFPTTPAWQATQMTLGDLLAYDAGGTASTAVKFHSATDPNDDSIAAVQARDYVTAAILANEIFANSGNTTVQGELTYALWAVFDSTAIPTLSSDVTNDGGGAAVAALATGYLQAAQLMATGFGGNYSTLDAKYISESIYTPAVAGVQELDAWTTVGSGSVPVSEPSAPALFAVYLSSLVGLIVLFRRRIGREAN